MTQQQEYPDVLGDYVGGGLRWEARGVQFVWRLEPQPTSPGRVVWLLIPMQSEWSVPASLTVHLELPRGRAKKSGAPLFEAQRDTEIPLEHLEVGELRLPIRVHTETPPGRYAFAVLLSGAPKERGERVRPGRKVGQVAPETFPFVEGLGLAQTLGVDYRCESRQRFRDHLQVTGERAADQASQDLTPIFASYWTAEDWRLQVAAQREVNERRAYLLRELEPRGLFPVLLDETRRRFAGTDLSLRIGEALMMAKALVITVQHFLSEAERQDGLLVPLVQAGQATGVSTSDPKGLLCQAGFPRLVRLAAALSFGLLRRALEQDPWSIEEEQAVVDLLHRRMATPGPLGPEFAYIPLVLGGLLVNRAVVMPGEDPGQTLALARKSVAARGKELGVVPELPLVLERVLDLMG
ncbi:MAG: hypothetical protein ACUVXG_14250 [Anaerolineae bacterium]